MINEEGQKTKWFGLVQEWIASDLTIRSFLKRHTICHSTFYRWRMRYEQEQLTQFGRTGYKDHRLAFVGARLTSIQNVTEGLSLEHPSGWRVQFASSTHPDLIARILKGLTCN